MIIFYNYHIPLKKFIIIIIIIIEKLINIYILLDFDTKLNIQRMHYIYFFSF